MKPRIFIFSFVILLIISLVILVKQTFAQNIAVTDSSSYEAQSSAMLDVQSSTKGMLVPRLTTSQRLSITSPAEGLLVYDVNYQNFFYYEQDEWLSLSSVSSSSDPDKALFHVTNSSGDTVFAVYNDGVEIIVPDSSTAKGKVGGFAVSGRSVNKGAKYDFLRVTPDSTRIVVNSDNAKGKVGGFAVSGRTVNKNNTEEDMLRASPSSVRIFINDSTSGKSSVGGFAVSGRSASKNITQDIFTADFDSTRVFVRDSISGFGVSNLENGTAQSFLNLNKLNYFIGHQTGDSLTTGQYNSIIGYQAGLNNTSGSNNILIGFKSGYNNITGGNNVFIGTESGYVNKYTFQNTYVGYRSGYQLSGASNTMFGSMAGEEAAGGNNTFIGSSAGRYATGGNNTFVGKSAGTSFNENSGFRNTYVGQSSGSFTTTGNYNVMMGFNSGYLNEEGSRNTFLGYHTGRNIRSGSGNIFIGYEAGYNEEDVNDRLFIENSSADSTSALIYGEFDNNILTFNADVGIGTTTPNYDLDIARSNATINLNGLEISNMGSNNMGIDGDIIPYSSTTYDIGNNVTGENWDDIVANELLSPSDKRTKKNIENMNIGLKEIMQLRPVQFQYKKAYDSDGGIKYGLVAQEVEEVIPFLVKGKDIDVDEQTGKKTITKGEFKTLNYTKLIPVLIRSVQQQQKEKEALEQRVEKLEEEINELKTLIQSRN